MKRKYDGRRNNGRYKSKVKRGPKTALPATHLRNHPSSQEAPWGSKKSISSHGFLPFFRNVHNALTAHNVHTVRDGSGNSRSRVPRPGYINCESPLPNLIETRSVVAP